MNQPNPNAPAPKPAGTPSSAGTPPRLRVPLLPERICKPLFLALVWLVPQALLLAMNVRSWWLVGGEMTTDQTLRMSTLVGMETGLLVLGALLCVTLWILRRHVHWLWAIPILGLHIAYLWLSFVWIPNGDLLPQATSLWILPPQRFLFQQFALIMPVTFYAGARLACFPSVMPKNQKLGVSLLSCILFPAMWYGVVMLVMWISSSVSRVSHGGRGSTVASHASNWLDELVPILLGIILIIATVLTLAAMIRFVTLLYRTIRAKGDKGMMLFCLFVGLIGPVAGLLLNRGIPFPFDFQTPVVYAFAVFNGILLTIPALKNRWLHRLQWFSLCVLFCYVVYFFLVFLPFLPLSLLAMIAMLSGLLMLVPMVLFSLQGMRIWDGYKRELKEWGRVPATLTLLLGLFALPACFVGMGMMHRTSLHQAIAYVFEQDPADAAGFDGNRGMLKTSLRQMHRAQNGFELPFITTAYNKMVFDGLTLPEAKLQRIHQTFFGDKLVVPKNASVMDDLGFMPSPQNTWRSTRKNRPPSTQVDLKKVTWTQTNEGDCTRAVAKLEVGFDGSGIREFVQKIDLPDGVFVSGFWLLVGKERVPGRIFEKKAALWVYQMIRDTSPRDPGLLYYETPNRLDLRVYPVNGGKNRTVEVEFLFPNGMDPVLDIGGQKWTGEADRRSTEAQWLRGAEGNGVMVSLPDNAPRMTRKPYLHFIIDRSEGARPLTEQLIQAQAIAGEKQIDEAMVTLANFESASIGQAGTLMNAAELQAAASANPAASLATRGGFLRGRMIQRALLMHDDLSGDPAWAQRVPHIVVIQDTKEPIDEDLDWFVGLCPDATIEVTAGPAFKGWTKASDSVCLLRSGDRTRAVGGRVGWLPQNADGVEPEWLVDGGFVPVGGDPLSCDRYAAGADVWTRHFERARRGTASGEDLTAMVKASRKTGILLPDTSYIVVENSAQWNMLELKEGEKLDANEQFEFDAPAPGILWLVAPWLAFLWVRKRRAARRAGSSVISHQ